MNEGAAPPCAFVDSLFNGKKLLCLFKIVSDGGSTPYMQAFCTLCVIDRTPQD